MKIRKSTKEDHLQMTKVLTAAFFEYPIFVSFLPEEKHRKEFLEELFTANVRVFEKINGSYVAVDDDDKVLGIMLFKDDKQSEPGFFRYLTNGNKELFKKENVRSLADFFKTIEEMDGEFISQDTSWYVDSLAIAPIAQGQGIGGLLLQKLDELVEQNKGGKVILSTNTVGNTEFYKKNGYTLVNHSTKNEFFETWQFEKNIK